MKELTFRKKALAGVLLATVVLLSLLALPACCSRGDKDLVLRPAPQPAPSIGYARFDVPEEAVPEERTQVQMRNVMFRVAPEILLHIHQLRGEMFDKRKGQPLNFDRPDSFIMKISSAKVGLDAGSLSTLMNEHVFGYPDAPLRDLKIVPEGSRLRQSGIMHKIIDIPFVMLAEVSVTSDGMIRIHPTSIEICDLNGKALMKAFGLNLEKLLDLSEAKGVRAEANDLVLDPVAILPPPAIEGSVSRVAVEGDELVQTFSSNESPASLDPPDPDQPNYMFFEGGTLRMGKLFMVRADMMVVDLDPSDPFDFFLNFYNNQLVAGYNENLADYGLEVFMRDFADLGKPLQQGERPSPSRASK